MLLTALLSVALAGPADTRDALDRLEELMEQRVNDGRLNLERISPAILVSARPRYEESADWYATGAMEVLQKALGAGGLRVCEACEAPRVVAVDGALSYNTGPISLDEVRRLDALHRGEGAPAKSVIWLDEVQGGVAIRVVELSTGQVLYAQNVDPSLVESRNTKRSYTLSEDLDRRARGDSLTQSFADFALYPGQHLSWDITDQFGATNANLAGVTMSLFDPVLGVGANYHRVTPFYNVTVGAKVIFSLPTALVQSVSEDLEDTEVLDPLLTGVAVVRVPFGSTNYGAVLCASTNGQVGLGISLMNIRILPILP
ncbi:MAG: hypothetical protein H6740_10670 [Alphaproteobacteria bacterium]|nr:hypothetical protein [Alphaproteobacteria bacterium]